MKSVILVEVKQKTGKELQQVELPNAFHRDVKDYLKTILPAVKYVAVAKDSDVLYHTCADTTDELSALINLVDVKYVYEVEQCIFYRSV